MARSRLLAASLLAICALALPIARDALESSMALHMLVQIPLLAAVGVALARSLPSASRARVLAVAGGVWPLVLTATFASSYWMLPRALDAALIDPWTEAAKFASLPLLAGAPLGLAWERLGVMGRGFVWTNAISMLAVLGWLYIAAPVRLCNGYLVQQQEVAGAWMVKLAVALLGVWLATLFMRPAAGSMRLSAAEHAS